MAEILAAAEDSLEHGLKLHEDVAEDVQRVFFMYHVDDKRCTVVGSSNFSLNGTEEVSCK